MLQFTHESRRLHWDACYNVRDIAGYANPDGGFIRPAAIIRSDTPSRLTDAGMSALVAYGVRTVIDLRTNADRAAHPPPFDRDGPHVGVVTYLHVPFYPDEEIDHPVVRVARDVAGIYIARLGTSSQYVARILATIAGAPVGGVLIHCHSGKDRTGLTIALLLALAGIPDEVIAEDYALSSEYLVPEVEEWVAAAPPEQRAQRACEAEQWRTRPETMLTVLEYLRSNYESVEGYLLRAGVTPEQIRRIRTRLLQ